MNIMFVFNLQNKVISYKYLNVLYWMLMPSFILTLNDCWNDASVRKHKAGESFPSELHFHLVVKRDKPTVHKSKSDGALAEGYSKRIGQIFPPEAQQ